MTRDYSTDPEDPQACTRDFDAFYTRFAGIYDLMVRCLPLWKRWLGSALPYIRGPRVLEVSFSSGYLLTQCPCDHEVWGLELSARMVKTARANLVRNVVSAALCQDSVFSMPYTD